MNQSMVNSWSRREFLQPSRSRCAYLQTSAVQSAVSRDGLSALLISLFKTNPWVPVTPGHDCRLQCWYPMSRALMKPRPPSHYPCRTVSALFLHSRKVTPYSLEIPTMLPADFWVTSYGNTVRWTVDRNLHISSIIHSISRNDRERINLYGMAKSRSSDRVSSTDHRAAWLGRTNNSTEPHQQSISLDQR